MKIIRINAPGAVEMVELPKPIPSRDEVLIKLMYVGLCGSDLSSYLGKNPMVKYPVVPGHEISGFIEELGSDVPIQFTIGQSVTVNPYTNCGSCPSCMSGRINACQFNETLGVQRNGALCEYITINWKKLIVHPDLNPQVLALVEPLSVGFHAVSRGRVDNTDTVMVLGCGMIGAGAISGAVETGAKVIAVDVDQGKLNLARLLGAKYCVNSMEKSLHETILEITNGSGPDVVIEAAGKPKTYLAAIEEVAFCGRVVCIGYAKENISFATKLFVQKEIDILGSRNALQNDFDRVIASLSKASWPFDALISKVYPLEKTNEALHCWAEDSGPVMKILISVESGIGNRESGFGIRELIKFLL